MKTALEQCAVKGEEEREEMVGADVANSLSRYTHRTFGNGCVKNASLYRVLDHLASHQEFNKVSPQFYFLLLLSFSGLL